MSLTAYDKIGPFREDFFIDSVDHEYCLRAHHKGFKIIFVLKPLFYHAMGYKVKVNFLGFKVTVSNYSHSRRYYIARNRLILTREYFLKEPGWLLQHLLSILASTIKIGLFEKEGFKKVKWTFIGILDAINKKMCRQPEN